MKKVVLCNERSNLKNFVRLFWPGNKKIFLQKNIFPKIYPPFTSLVHASLVYPHNHHRRHCSYTRTPPARGLNPISKISPLLEKRLALGASATTCERQHRSLLKRQLTLNRIYPHYWRHQHSSQPTKVQPYTHITTASHILTVVKRIYTPIGSTHNPAIITKP